MKLKDIDYKEIPKLNEKEWKAFRIEDLFYKFETGRVKNASALEIGGDIPYVGATNRNNGVMRFVIANDDILSKGNCIVFIAQGDGSAGYSVYRKSDSACGGTVICAYSEHLNEYTGLFISCCSDMNESKYSHGYSRKMPILKRDHIMLPVNDDGKPDYDYMEQYVKNMVKQKMRKYVDYIC